MSPERQKKVEDLFLETLAQPAEAQLAFLQSACPTDEALRKEVESLLTNYDAADDFLEKPVYRLHALPPDEEAPIFEGDTIGPYKIIELLGRGGMGGVYLGLRDDDQFKQFVAIKVIKRGMDTDEILRRFNQERQILAALDHPNIAHVLDGGMTTQGTPYFVMRYIDGLPLHVYCDEHKLPLRARLHLFLKVCNAVHYAHQNLVVHRDLKPSNILVTTSGEPILVDFGIAKLLNADLMGQSVAMTRTFIRPMTPEYASPEQVRGGTITTASDVYALGVLLYQLLTGHRPYDLKSRLPHEIERIICTEPPVRPSTMVTKAIAVDTNMASSLSIEEARSTSMDRLKRYLQGDLDTIVLMAMRKEPRRRYASAEQLAQDVQHYLDGLPVLAQPDTLTYRTRKFVQRHRYGVLTAAGIVLLLMTFGISMAIQSLRVGQALTRAEAERDKAEQISTVLTQMFEVLHPDEARSTEITGRELLDQGAIHIQQTLPDQPELQASLLTRLGGLYQSLGLYDESETLLQRALALRQQLYGSQDARIPETLDLLGKTLTERGSFESAMAHLSASVSYRRLHVSTAPDALAQSLMHLGYLQRKSGAFDEAIATYTEAIGLMEQHHGAPDLRTAQLKIELGYVFREQRAYVTAEHTLLEAIDMLRNLYGEQHTDIAEALYQLAMLYRLSGDFAKAEDRFQQALSMMRAVYGDNHRRVALCLFGYGHLQTARQNYRAAEGLYRQALAMRETVMGPDHPVTAFSYMHLGRTMLFLNQPTEAERLIRKALAIREAKLAPSHWLTANARQWLGRSLVDQGRYAEAEPYLLDGYHALRRAEQDQGVDAHEIHATLDHLILLYTRWGKAAQAVPYQTARTTI